jgi:hypothetical protein
VHNPHKCQCHVAVKAAIEMLHCLIRK